MTINRAALKAPLVILSAVALTGLTGAAAFALAGASPFAGSSTDSGNSQPIDDNHAPIVIQHGAGQGGHGADDATPEATPEPGDDNGADDRATDDSATDDSGVDPA